MARLSPDPSAMAKPVNPVSHVSHVNRARDARAVSRGKDESHARHVGNADQTAGPAPIRASRWRCLYLIRCRLRAVPPAKPPRPQTTCRNSRPPTVQTSVKIARVAIVRPASAAHAGSVRRATTMANLPAATRTEISSSLWKVFLRPPCHRQKSPLILW